MVTESDVKRWREQLSLARERAAVERQWERIAALSGAIGQLERWQPGNPLPISSEKLSALIGESVPRREPPFEDTTSSEPAADYRETSLSEPELLPVVPTIADTLPVSDSPSVERVDAQEEQPLAEETPVMLKQLRSLLGEEVQLSRAGEQAARLERTAQAILESKRSSPEAEKARQHAVFLRDVEDLHRRLEECRHAVERAVAKNDMNAAEEAIRRATTLRNTAVEDRFAGVHELAKAAAALLEDANDAKEKIAGLLERFTTLFARGRKVEALEELDSLGRLPQPPPVVKDPRGGGGLIPRLEAYDYVLTDYQNFCRDKAQKYLDEAQDYLEPEDPERIPDPEQAKKHAKEAMEQSIRNKWVGNALVDEERKLTAFIAQAARAIRRWTEAERWLEKAANTPTTDPASALQFLSQAEELYPRLPGLQRQKKSWIEALGASLDSSVCSAVSKSRALRRERSYLEALDELNRARRTLGQSPQLGLDLDPLEKELNKEQQAVEKEQEAWLTFRRRMDGTRERIEQGRLDERARRDIERQFSEREREWFAAELAELEMDLARQVDEQTIFDMANALFQKNRTDARIPKLLAGDPENDEEGIGSGSSLYSSAQRLLRRHYAHAALAQARRRLADHASLIEKPKDWLDTVRQAVQTVEMNTTDEDARLSSEAQEMLAAAGRLRQWQGDVASLVRRGEYRAALESLQDHARREDLAPELLSGLDWLQYNLRREWRDMHVQFIGQVLSKDTPQLRDLRQAAAALQELEEHDALTEDGDWLLAGQLRRRWHESEVTAIVGVPLEDVDDDTISALAKRRDTNWRRLLEHLEGLTRPGHGGEGATQRRAGKLSLVALGHYSLEISREEGIRLLENQREQAYLSDHPIVCTTLVLRLLEQEDGHSKAEGIVAELARRGRQAMLLAEALGLLLGAHTLHDGGDLRLAIAHLQEGADALVRLMPEFGSGLERAIDDTGNRWRRTLGNSLLNEAQAEEPSARGLGVFAVLAKLQEAEELLGKGDRRLNEIRARLQQRAKTARTDLHRAVGDLLVRPPDSLREAVRRGKELKTYLEMVAGPHLSRRQGRDQLANELAQDDRDLGEQWADWDSAWQDVTRAREELRLLLENDEWTWNVETGKLPMKAIREAMSLLSNAQDLGQHERSEVKGLLGLARALQTAVRELSQPFADFCTHFEQDDYNNQDDFDRAEQQLHRLRSEIERWELQLDEPIRALGQDYPVVNLRRFFQARNKYRQTKQMQGVQNGKPRLTWVESGAAHDVNSIEEAERLLRKRRGSLREWQAWIESASQALNELGEHLRDADGYLKRAHLLGRAEEFLDEQIPRALQKVDSLHHRIQDLEPPQCQAALTVARSTRALQDDPDYGRQLPDILARLPSAPWTGIGAVWAEVLQVEMAMADKKGEELRSSCIARKKELRGLCDEMDGHCKHTLDHIASRVSQEAYWELLELANDIDREDERVGVHRQRCEKRDDVVKRREQAGDSGRKWRRKR